MQDQNEDAGVSRRGLLALGSGLMGAAALGGTSSSTAKPAAANASAALRAHNSAEQINIAMLAYPGMTALDLIGPFHFLSFVPNAKIHLVTNQSDLRPFTGNPGPLIQPTVTLADCPSDVTVLFAPGGTAGTLKSARDPGTLEFMRDRASRAKYITSVCTGAVILGAAGLLHGKRATTHWTTVDALPHFGAIPVRQRVVEDGNLITGAGVSAGLDFGLLLLDRLTDRKNAETALLMTEYAPEPPFPGGSFETARPEIRGAIASSFRGFVDQVKALQPLSALAMK